MNNSSHIRDGGWTENLKERMSDYKTSVPEDLWTGINTGMEKNALPAGEKVIFRRIGILSAIAAAVLFGIFFGYKALLPGAGESPRISSSTEATVGGSSSTLHGSGNVAISIEDKSSNASLLAGNVNSPKDQDYSGGPAGNSIPVPDSLSERESVSYPGSDSAEKDKSGDAEAKKNSVSASGGLSGKETAGDYIDSYPGYPEEKKSSGLSVTAGLFAAGMSGNENSKMGEGSFMMGANPLEGDNVNMAWAAKGPGFLGNSSNNMSDFTYHHKFPVRMGVTVKLGLSPRFFVGSGLYYSRLYSDISSGTSKDGIKGSQVLHYVGLPLNVSYDLFDGNRFAFYCTGGGIVEKCISGKVRYDTIYGSRVLSSTSKSIKINQLQWSLNAALGLRADITDYAGLYVEPGISYHFDDGSPVTTVYKDRPLDFNLAFGLCFYFK